MPGDRTTHFLAGTPEMALDAVALSDVLRRLLNASASVRADSELIGPLLKAMDAWSERLERAAGSEDESLWRKARRDQPPALLPLLHFDVEADGRRLAGDVTFGRFHVGQAAAHGGAVGLVFDEVMGALAGSAGRSRGRTAYLNVSFRALTPIDKRLSIHAWFEAEAGRKRRLRAEIRDGDRVCAEAEGLWLALKPGQS